MNKTLSKKQLSDGSILLFSDNAACHMHHLGDLMALHTCKGVISGEFAAGVIADGERHLEKYGKCIYMVDCFDSPKMTGEFRDQVVNWMVKHSDRLETHLLVNVNSWMTTMIANVANMMLGRRSVKLYSSIEAWTIVGKSYYPAFRRRSILLTYDAMASL